VKKISSKIILVLFLASALSLVVNIHVVKATLTPVYIRADGSVDPSSAPITKSGSVYTVTEDMINSSIIIERNGMILDGGGHVLEGDGTGEGVSLSGRSNVIIQNFHIMNYQYGIYVLSSSSYVTVSKNNITDLPSQAISIWIKSSTNCTVSENTIDNYGHGIFLQDSDHNTIHGNIIKKSIDGIRLDPSANSLIHENTLANSTWGIWISSYSSTNNKIFHNNFIDNQYSSYCYTSQNWSDGYPSGGNYWSNLKITDKLSGSDQNETGSDGINDNPYLMVLSYKDPYPLCAPFRSFSAGIWKNQAYDIDIISNSSVSNFNFDTNASIYPKVSFLVEGLTGTIGFCRLAIPRGLMWCDDLAEWTITINGTTIIRTIIETTNCTCIYFTYNHSVKAVQVQSTHAIPEFQFPIMPLLIVIATLLAAMVNRRKQVQRVSNIQ